MYKNARRCKIKEKDVLTFEDKLIPATPLKNGFLFFIRSANPKAIGRFEVRTKSQNRKNLNELKVGYSKVYYNFAIRSIGSSYSKTCSISIIDNEV